jgi:regulator of RNase E activity RraA
LGDKHGPGEINCPISCGGVSVNPGDIIVGDANGVVVVNREIVKDVLVLAKEKIEQDNKWLEEILNGVTIKSDVDRELKYNGVI